jgi:hypothetical protein
LPLELIFRGDIACSVSLSAPQHTSCVAQAPGTLLLSLLPATRNLRAGRQRSAPRRASSVPFSSSSCTSSLTFPLVQKSPVTSDQYPGKSYRITTASYYGDRRTARVKTYGDVLVEYEFHPEPKCADTDGNTCSKRTIGLLQRRHIQIGSLKYIGKESNSLEEVESGMEHSAENVYTEYPDATREWTTTRRILQKFPMAFLEQETKLKPRT